MNDDQRREVVARALWDYDQDGTSLEWRDMAWADMGGSEPDDERLNYEMRADAALAALAPALDRESLADALSAAIGDALAAPYDRESWLDTADDVLHHLRLAQVQPDPARVLPDPTAGCCCTWHNQDAGGGYTETVVEYDPACPEHSVHLYDPRSGTWVLQPDPSAAMQTQARICPTCHDDHSEQAPCPVRPGYDHPDCCDHTAMEYGHCTDCYDTGHTHPPVQPDPLRAGVQALHKPVEVPVSEHYYCDPQECDRAGEDDEMRKVCDADGDDWPCATFALLAETEVPR